MRTLTRISLVTALVWTVGCARPKLASRRLTEQHVQWAHLIQRNYPAWKPPFLSPVRGADVAAPQSQPTPGPLPDEMPEPAPSLGPVEVLPDTGFEPAPLLPPVGEQEMMPVGPAPLVPLDTAPQQRYSVQKGDTLHGIAVRLLGDQSKWRQLLDLNRDIIETPEDLQPGMKLLLPPGAREQ